MPGDDEFPLADLLRELTRNLRESNRRTVESEEDPYLVFREATVELGLTWEHGAHGGIDFKVVKLGGKVTRNDVQTIAITVGPADPEKPILVGRPAVVRPAD